MRPTAAIPTRPRCFSRFQEEGVLQVKQRQVRILDPADLQTLVNRAECAQCPC